MITVEDILATFPGTREIADPFKRVENVTEWGAGAFRGGPLDGQRRDVPKFGPAFVRWHGEDAVHWYARKKGSLRTYLYAGETASEGRRSDPQLTLGPAPSNDGLDGLEVQLEAIAGREPASSWIEVRLLDPVRPSVWIGAQDPDRAAKVADTVRGLREHHSVHIGATPRARKQGTDGDVARCWTLWADCDSPGSTAKLWNFTPAPSIVICSGQPLHAHAYWPLTTPLPGPVARAANQRLRVALDGDNVANPSRVLRPIGSRNHKPGGKLAYLIHARRERFDAKTVVGRLADQSSRPPARPRKNGRNEHDSELVPVNARHHELVRFCGWLRSRGFDEEMIVECGHAFLNHAVERDPAKPIDRAHAERSMRWIAQHYPPYLNRGDHG